MSLGESKLSKVVGFGSGIHVEISSGGVQISFEGTEVASVWKVRVSHWDGEVSWPDVNVASAQDGGGISGIDLSSPVDKWILVVLDVLKKEDLHVSELFGICNGAVDVLSG